MTAIHPHAAVHGFPRLKHRGLIEAVAENAESNNGSRFPRLKHRGLIEAGPPSLQSALQMFDFRDSNIAASLKRAHVGAFSRTCLNFRDSNIAASLKRLVPQLPEYLAPDFRDSNIAASLKLNIDASQNGDLVFPRLKHRGLIEANPNPLVASPDVCRFPRLKHRGLIEAWYRSTLLCSSGTFPRLKHRGLIEA